MNIPFEVHIALRYLLAKRKQAFISVISLISTLGVTVGVMALVIASALMLANVIWNSPGTSAVGLAVIAAGMPIYWWMRRGKL